MLLNRLCLKYIWAPRHCCRACVCAEIGSRGGNCANTLDPNLVGE